MATILYFEAQQVINAQRHAIEIQEQNLQRLQEIVEQLQPQSEGCRVVRMKFR